MTDQGSRIRDRGTTMLLVAFVVSCSPGNPAGGPTRGAQAGPTLGIGRAATQAEINAIDIDVRPDGQGLPPGGANAVEGAKVYAQKCASCHGAEGQGGPSGGVALVGRIPNDAFNFGSESGGGGEGGRKTIGSYWPYATTVYDYINRAMPPERPGSLTPEEIYGVTAFLLWKNQLIGETDRMDRQTLPAVKMPSRDKFVPDDRERTTRVR